MGIELHQEPSRRASPPDKPYPPATPTPPAPETKPLSRARVKRTDSTSAKSTVPQKPDGNLVEFEVREGLAIAYGDLILGEVEPGAEAKRGTYDAPVPETWTRGEVPYAYHRDFVDRQRVEDAIAYFHQYTPIRFIPYSGQKDAILFENGAENCYSMLGKVGGFQPVRLSRRCRTQEILHELMHAIGFIHEHSRPDRDQYIEVFWPNIRAGYEPQFAIVPDSFADKVRGHPFDFRSVMLYDARDFSLKEGLPTFRSRTGEKVSPTRNGLSDGDLAKIRQLYE